MKNILIILALVFATASFSQASTDIHEMGALVLKEIDSTSKGLQNVGEDNGGYDWYLNVIRVRVNASVGVEIPWIASAKLMPEIELFWTR